MKVANREAKWEDRPEVDIIKRAGIELQRVIEDNAPACRRRAIALTHLETALLFAVKAAVDPDTFNE